MIAAVVPAPSFTTPDLSAMLRLVNVRLQNVVQRQLKPFDLTNNEYAVLCLLATQCGPMDLCELKAIINITDDEANGALLALVIRHLVEREVKEHADGSGDACCTFELTLSGRGFADASRQNVEAGYELMTCNCPESKLTLMRMAGLIPIAELPESLASVESPVEVAHKSNVISMRRR